MRRENNSYFHSRGGRFDDRGDYQTLHNRTFSRNSEGDWYDGEPGYNQGRFQRRQQPNEYRAEYRGERSREHSSSFDDRHDRQDNNGYDGEKHEWQGRHRWDRDQYSDLDHNYGQPGYNRYSSYPSYNRRGRMSDENDGYYEGYGSRYDRVDEEGDRNRYGSHADSWYRYEPERDSYGERPRAGVNGTNGRYEQDGDWFGGFQSTHRGHNPRNIIRHGLTGFDNPNPGPGNYRDEEEEDYRNRGRRRGY